MQGPDNISDAHCLATRVLHDSTDIREDLSKEGAQLHPRLLVDTMGDALYASAPG